MNLFRIGCIVMLVLATLWAFQGDYAHATFNLLLARWADRIAEKKNS